jgi:hypothetical protein
MMNKFRLLPHLLTLLLIGCSTSPLNWQADSGTGGIGGTGLFDSNIPGGIGGTGKSIEEGIGGTGRVAKHSEGSGAGGSGIGGTGIVGTITAFGSIWVNDAHIHFNESTPITINQTPATSGELQLGQVVAVNSSADGDAYYAKTIDIVHEVVGPVDALSPSSQTLEILNQTVLIKDDTVIFSTLAQNEFDPNQIISGSYIEVSGLRQDDGDIVASRIDIIEAPEQVQLIGELTQSTQGNWQINGQNIEIDSLLVPDNLDKRLLVSGYLENGNLIAESIGVDSIEMVLEDVSELIYEGYYFEDEIDGLISIGGMEFAIEEVIEFSDEFDFDEPLRVNAILSDEGIYEAEDLLIELEHEDYYIDLLHEEEFEHEDMWIEDDYFEDDHYEDDHYEEDFEDDEFYEEDD